MAWHDVAWCGIILQGVAKQWMVLYGMRWYCIACNSAVLCCMAWWACCWMVWHRNALHRLYGVALYVMVWHSMAWLGCIDRTYTLLLIFTFWGASSKSDYLITDLLIVWTDLVLTQVLSSQKHWHLHNDVSFHNYSHSPHHQRWFLWRGGPAPRLLCRCKNKAG